MTIALPDESPNEANDRGRRLAVGRWSVVGVAVEGEPIQLRDVNPWEHEWENLDAEVELQHPTYPHQSHRIDIWRISIGRRMIYFAAGELSTSVWAFYLPAE